MEVFLFLMFITGSIIAVIITIILLKIKYRINDLQKQIVELSTRQETSIHESEMTSINILEKEIKENTSEIVKSNDLKKPLRVLKRIEKTPNPNINKNININTDINTNANINTNADINSNTNSNTNIKTNTNTTQKKVISKDKTFTIESIISKLGILLLLISIGFLYKLAYDKGYVTPSIIILFGYVFGIVVIAMGFRVSKKNREVLSQVLYGGGVAILYITTFAAYQGYGLIKGVLTFIILCSVTFLSFYISLSINSLVMSIISLLGSLLIPFAVGVDVLGLYGTGLYILFVTIGSMTIYIFKRWRVLQLTSIVVVNGITLLLTSEAGFTSKETVEFSVLLLAILVVFYGVEYMHYYLCRDNNELVLTAALISSLPIFTLFQALMVLDISEESWALIFAIVSIVFYGLNYLLYKKRAHSLITDIILGYIALFTLVGIILYFGGEVRYIAILILSVIFTVIYLKSGYFLTRLIGLAIYLIGFWWAFLNLIEQVLEGNINTVEVFVRVIVMGLITTIACMQKDIMRKVLGGLAFQLYFIVAIISMALIFTEDIIDPMIVFLAVFGVAMLLFIWLGKKFEILSIQAIVIMSILPFILKVIGSSYVLYDNSVDWISTLAFILYGIEMYIISLTIMKNNVSSLIFIFKLIGYGILTNIVLVEIPVWSEHFGYGIVLFACIVLVMNFLEASEDKFMKSLIFIFKIGFIGMFVVYILFPVNEFNILYFILDIIMLVPFYYFISNYIKEVKVVFVINAIMYMLVIYQNLSLEENGMVTLLWAAYGITSLAFFLFKGRRKLVNISLVMIVLVATKFILIDLSTIEVIWKIATSMAFGLALLILSYVIQPLLDKYEN